MLQRETIEAVMMELAHQQGQTLNGRDRLAIRTGVAQTMQARTSQAENDSTYLPVD